MEGDFHEAAVMGHDILGLSAGLDSVANLLELGACNESIYSSGLGIDDDHHHDGSMIDYSIIDSSRSVLEGDLGVTHIPLDGLIPLVATHQLPTSPNSFGNARVKITSRDFVHLDGKDTTSIDASGNLSSLLNDPIVSTSLSTTQLASLGKVRTPSSDCVGKGNTSLNSEDATSFDVSGNISSLLNDPIVSTCLSTTQLASLGKVRTHSIDCAGKGDTSLNSEDATSFDASGNISSLLNDHIVSTSLSTTCTQLASLIKIRTPSNDCVGKRDTSVYSEGSSSIKATSNLSSSVGDTLDSTSLHTTCQLATLKKAKVPLRKSLETGVALEQLKTHGHMRHLTHTQASKATSKRREHPSKAETARSRTSGLKGTRSPKQKDPKHFRCSMCGAVYKSHELCVNHVLNRHKPGMSIKHQLSCTHSKNTQKMHLHQGVRNSYLEPHGDISNHAISQDSVKLKSKSAIDSKTKTTESQQSPKVYITAKKDLSRLTVTVRRAIKNVNSQIDPATNSIFAKNLEAKIDCESIPSSCKRTLLILKSNSAIGSKPKTTKLPGSANLNTSTQRDSSRSKVTKRPMKIIDSSNDLATKSKFRENLKKIIPCKSSPAHCQIASMKFKCKRPIYSKTKRTESPQNPKVIIITQNKIVADSSRLQAILKKAERSVDSKNDLARKSKFGENLHVETNVDSKSGQASRQITSTKLKSKSAIGSETKIPSGTKVNTCTSTLTKNLDTALIDSSAFMPEDMGTQEIEDESNWSDISPVKKPKSSPTTSAKKRRCVALKEKREYGDRTKESKKLKRSSKRDAKHRKEGAQKRTKEDGGSTERCVAIKEKREYGDRTKESKKLKRSSKRDAKHCKEGAQKRTKEDGGSTERCVALKEKKEYGDRTKESKKLKRSSKRGAKHHNEGARKRTKEDGGSAERVVRLLDPRQLTIVICPQCQKAFTTYTGYSLHTTQVHNVSANDSPGMLKQLLVQRSPRYSSNHTAILSLDEPRDSEHCGNDGIYQQRVEMGMCHSVDSLNVEEHRSDQVQLASSRAIGKDSSKGRPRETDNLALDEPPFNQDNEDIVGVSNEQIIELRPDAFEVSCRAPHKDELKVNESSNAERNLAVKPGNRSSVVDLLTIKHRQSVRESSKISKMEQVGSILCSSCGVVFKDSSDLDDDHELASEPGELVCHWTAPEETTAGSLYLCPVCGMCIPSHTDLNGHSCETDVCKGVPS